MSSAAQDRCACGGPLVACEKCGDSRCLVCDPYDASDICSAAKVGRTRRWNSLRSEIAFQGFGWWLLRLLRGQRTYGWKLWKP